MIRTILSECKFGIEPVDDGIQINLFDEQSNQVWHIPFQGEALKLLITHAAPQLSDEHKREVSRLFTGGIVIPTGNNTPPLPPQA